MDADLRALERAIESGGPAERLALASALERRGRVDEALSVLLPACEDATVRREIGRFPAWGHPEGTGGNTRFVDLPPLAAAPRLLWATRPFGSRESLLVSPLGVVTGLRDRGESWTIVLDAETGADRKWPEASESAPQFIAGDVLVVSQAKGRLAGRDLWTGAELWSEKTDEGTAVHADGLVAFLSERRKGVVGLALTDPRKPPRKLWKHDISASLRRSYLPRPVVAVSSRETVVVVESIPGLSKEDAGIVLHGATGKTRWTFTGGCGIADASAVLALKDEESSRHELRDLAGERVWTARFDEAPVVLSPDFVIVPREGRVPGGLETSAALLDRKTGQRRAWLPKGGRRHVCASRDVVYGYDGPTWDDLTCEGHAGVGSDRIYAEHDWSSQAITAATIAGEVAWRFPTKPPIAEEIIALAPASRRLYGLTAGGTVFCLG
ncbi:PQQ-binding-like beta-propeller repeat protein [bacterium]|nr:PQQ-binding-like beta-propeller repeat protein [bacterium]